MAKPRAILKRANAVRSTARITNTMRMIATARYKKAFDRAVAARPYTDRLGKLIGELSAATGDFRHPLIEEREEKNVTLLGIASNRGLCGGYNSNVSKETVRTVARLEAAGAHVESNVAGKRLAGMLKYAGVRTDHVLTHLDDRPRFEQINEMVTPFLAAYEAGQVDGLYIVYTKFLSASRQEAVTERVLPLSRPEGVKASGETDYIFSPDPETILSELLPRSVRLKVFQAFLDASVSEQSARMIAMQGATENAYELIRTLTQQYNRSRQALITTELSEIMGGVAALE